jgi:thymidylate kinase
MIIILEGANGCGKSTFANELKEKYNIPIIKDHQQGFNFYRQKALEYDNYILDRFHLGEYVYPILKRGGRVPLETWQQHIIERILMIKNCILLYCNTSFEFKKNIFNTRGEDFIDINEIEKETELFNTVFEKSILNKYKVDLIFNSKKDIYDIIDKELFKDNSFEKYESIGNINFPIMLIGEKYDRISEFNFGKNKYLKCFIDDKNSSKYLHTALSNSKYKNQFYITNAYKTSDADQDLKLLKEEISLLSPKKIIVLGNNAEKLFKNLNLEYIKISHPQYFSRFKYFNVIEYTSLIDNAIGDLI